LVVIKRNAAFEIADRAPIATSAISKHLLSSHETIPKRIARYKLASPHPGNTQVRDACEMPFVRKVNNPVANAMPFLCNAIKN
jgi:hypothetical protein